MNKIVALGLLTILPLILTACIIRDPTWNKPPEQSNMRPTPAPYHTRPANLHGANNDLKTPTPSIFNISSWNSTQTN